jgi:hypothetical protein
MTRVSSKVGSATNEAIFPRRALLFPRRIERKEAVVEIEVSVRATGALQCAHRRRHWSLRHEYRCRSIRSHRC